MIFAKTNYTIAGVRGKFSLLCTAARNEKFVNTLTMIDFLYELVYSEYNPDS